MPRNARVVLIGIDDYPLTADPSLAGPVDDAIRFARFFRSEGVPPEQITLLLGSAEQAPDTIAGVAVRQANHKTIRQVLLSELPTASEGQLYLLWGGHGFVDVERNRRLRFPDARPTEPADLDVDSLLRTYASDLVPRLDRQVWLIDACQVHQEYRGHETFPSGAPAVDRTQDVLFAAGIGQPAANLRIRRTGVFSREVLRVLETVGLDGLTKTENFVQILSNRFVEMRADGLTDQIPTYLRHRSLIGDESAILTWPSARRTANPGSMPGPDDLRSTVDTLTAVPEWNRPQYRDEIVANLPLSISSMIPRSAIARHDAIGTVRICTQHRGGLRELIGAVRFYRPDDEIVERFAEAATHLAEVVGDR